MAKYLFLGGPRHGDQILTDDAPTFRVSSINSQIPAALWTPGQPVPPPQTDISFETYIRRELAGTVNGSQYVRAVYVHTAVPGPREAEGLLVNHLLGQWLTQGELVPAEQVDTKDSADA